jgi:transposase-like protein
MVKPKRQYSDSEKAEYLAALDANGGNLRHTARQTGIALATLQGWAQGRGVSSDCSDLRTQKKEALSDRLEVIAHSLVDAIPSAISGANLQQITTSLAIAIDKMLLLKGQPTEITPVSNMTDEERLRRLTELVQKAMARNPNIRLSVLLPDDEKPTHPENLRKPYIASRVRVSDVPGKPQETSNHLACAREGVATADSKLRAVACPTLREPQ